jgi:hypothetical protein
MPAKSSMRLPILLVGGVLSLALIAAAAGALMTVSAPGVRVARGLPLATRAPVASTPSLIPNVSREELDFSGINVAAATGAHPNVSESGAVNVARNNVGGAQTVISTTLVTYNGPAGSLFGEPRLTWVVSFDPGTVDPPVGRLQDGDYALVFVDATSGEFLFHIRHIS